MKRISLFIISVTMLMSLSLIVYASDSPPSYQELTQYWAPLLYHDVGISYGEQGLEDIPMKINFDNDWTGANNWENLEIEYHIRPGYDYKAYIYSSVSETTSHYFITYAVFHPKDESNFIGSLDKHENDMEHIIIAIAKDGSTYGRFDKLITQAHRGWNFYLASDLLFENSHPKVWIDAGAHAIYKYDGSSAGGVHKDGIIFYPTENHSIDASSSFFHDLILTGQSDHIGNFVKRYEYVVLDYNEIFEKNLEDAQSGNYDTFSSTFGKISGDTHGTNSAGAIWGATGFNDLYDVFAWSDPVAFFDGSFNNQEMSAMSHEYISNNNYTYSITLDTLTYSGGNHNIYMDIYVNDVKYASNHSWLQNITTGSAIDVKFFNTGTTSVFSVPSDTIYIARPYSDPSYPTKLKIDIKRKKGLIFYDVDSLTIRNIDMFISDEFQTINTNSGKAAITLKVSRQDF